MADDGGLQELIGRRVRLPSHFVRKMTVEAARALGSSAEIRVRLASGELDEAVLSAEDLAPLLASELVESAARPPADAERLRLLIESARIGLAYAYDRQFAVSLSGIRTLPHQIEAGEDSIRRADWPYRCTCHPSGRQSLVPKPPADPVWSQRVSSRSEVR